MKRKIKVCFVQSFGYSVFNPDSNARIGGAEVDLYNIATELAKDERFDVYFLVADFGQKDIEIYNGVKVIKGHSQKKTLKNFIYSFYIFYKKLHQINADIYFTANLSKYVGLTNFYCKIFKKIHIHRTEHEGQVIKSHIIKNILKGKLKYLSFYLGFINVNHIVVQNDEHQRLLKKTFNFPSTVIRNSYIIPPYNKNSREFILWVARGEKWKRPEIFIELAKAFPTESFVMIMPLGSDKDFFKKIKNKAEKLENLKFIPGVPFSKVNEYYKRAKVFVNTSLSEGFPNSFNQAMNASTPILSLNINPDNFINKYNVGLYCNNDFELLKENLNVLLKNEDLWKNLSENSLEFVKEHMNIKKSIKIWKKIFLYFYNKLKK
ncbi:MAG: glycosyltransferase family 4 protein [Promethearchaeia archaeon]